MNESLQPSSQTPALAPVGLPPPCRPPLPCPALRWDSAPVLPLGLPTPSQGRVPLPGLAWSTLDCPSFLGPLSQPETSRPAVGREAEGGAEVWAWLRWRSRPGLFMRRTQTHWLARPDSPTARGGLAALGLGQTGWVRGQRAGGGAERAKLPPPVLSRVPGSPHTHRTSCPRPTG